jgi:tetratricopeptide (TPR) repeat protein
LKTDPDNREVRIALGILYYDLRRFDLAVAEFSAVLEKNINDNRIRYLLANVYEEKGDNKLALDEYRKIPATSSELYASAQIHAAMIFKKEGKITAAIELVNGALKKKKDQISLYLYLSSLYEETKDNVKAVKILDDGITLLPQSVDLRYALGVIYEKTNHFPESIKEMETVLKLDPENAEALNFIGYSYADRGMNLEEAEKLIIKALKIKPDNGYMIDSLGWVHFKQNNMDSAVKNLKRALELLPNDANITEHLGDVYSKLGKIKEAQEMYNRALKLDPPNSLLQKKLEELIRNK